ncbi:hypothetical protein [Nonomuraea longicatena]|uniref:Uncharacterized protein n=1 Tax=Nonomuraea longicatena TaxID=83682 RepID=A0ABN1QSK2_9ACTN
MRLRVSPVVPTVASVLLAALWALSVFAGWSAAAFCPAGPPECTQQLEGIAGFSAFFAVLATVCTAAAWLMPAPRRDQRTFSLYMGSAVATWIVAESVLFLGGHLITPAP